MRKLEYIEQDIIKTKESISRQQEKLKELEAQKTEAENLQIVQMVRAQRMTPAELSAFLDKQTAAITPTTTRFYREEDTKNE